MSKITKEDLLRVFPLDRDPKVQPLMCDVFDTVEGDFEVVGTMNAGPEDKLLLVVGDLKMQRIILLRQAWNKLMKGASVITRAEDTLPEKFKSLLNS